MLSAAFLPTLLVLGLAAPASATPNMIRLGYPHCSSCHLSPQGGGLLNRYGEGIDLAQTLRPEEPRDSDLDQDPLGTRLNYDVRASLAIDRDPPEAAGYGFNLSLRTAIGLTPKGRLVYSASVRAPTLTRERSSGAITVGMSRLYWMYQPKDGLQFVVGRDDLPTGLGGGVNFARRTTNPSVSSTPTQAKMFWWNRRWETSVYGFGPDGNETQRQFRSYGGGGLIGMNVWRDRAVVGLSARVSKSDAFDRQNAAAFLRLGLTKHFGLLTEHEVTERTTSLGARPTYIAGHTELFFVPFDWLQTALTAQHITTTGGDTTYRLSPSVEMRLTSNVKLSFDTLDVFQPAAADSRTFSFQVQVKTQ
jgi:hypothetical protein